MLVPIVDVIDNSSMSSCVSHLCTNRAYKQHMVLSTGRQDNTLIVSNVMKAGRQVTCVANLPAIHCTYVRKFVSAPCGLKLSTVFAILFRPLLDQHIRSCTRAGISPEVAYQAGRLETSHDVPDLYCFSTLRNGICNNQQLSRSLPTGRL